MSNKTPDPYDREFTDDEQSRASSETASDISHPESTIPDLPPTPDDIPESETPLEGSFYRNITANKKALLNEEGTHNAVAKPAAVMEMSGINLPIFLDAISWGNDRCTGDPALQHQRTALLHSSELPQILERPAGASKTLKAFAVETTTEMIDRELRVLGPLLRLPARETADSSKLTELGIQEMTAIMKKNSPGLWKVLEAWLTTEEQGKRNTVKNPEKVIFTIVSMIVYSRSHHFNRLQKLLGLYLKFRGLSAKGFDTLHAMGLTMSHKWACDIVLDLSEGATKEMLEKMEQYPWVDSYDNVNIPFRVFSQRVDNLGELGSGTASTIYIKRDAPHLGKDVNERLREKRAEGLHNPIDARFIFGLEQKAHPYIQAKTESIVLWMLLNSPEFDLKTYRDRRSPILQPPAPLDALPTGLDHITLQYLLGTVNIPEVSYQNHSNLVQEWLAQLGFKTKELRKKLATSKIVTWVGDQLTVDRLRRLWVLRGSEDNAYDRLDFSVFVFGWLHLQMAYANSLHKQYLGTSSGRGLAQCFELLGKSGLFNVKTQGPFHHDLVEALYEVATAHIREDWLRVGKVQSLAELRTRSAQELKALAVDLVHNHASTDAIDELGAAKKVDQQKKQVVMFNRDVLGYIVLDEAIKGADVGMMEAMLPTLLIRFLGSGNSKYANEVLELLQGLHREWDAEVADFVRRHGWLVNFTGKPDGWCPIDKAQEINIKDIKVTYRSQGPNVKWDYLKKLHPAIPTIRKVITFMEEQYGTLVRGKRHAIPSREKDILKLRKSFADSGFHDLRAQGRTITSEKDLAEDFFAEGAKNLQLGPTLFKWHDGREFPRATGNRWYDQGGVAEGEGSSANAEGSGAVEGGSVADRAPGTMMDVDAEGGPGA